MLSALGVTQITIPLPFRLNHVNCFLAEGSRGWMVMDAGLHTEETRKIWKPFIENHEIRDIYITHYHPDHFGYAGALQRLTGADVWMTETDANNGLTYWEKESLQQVRQNYRACGLHAQITNELTADEESFRKKVTPYPVVHHFNEEGMTVQFGKYEYEVIFTPGHSDGLFVLYNKEKSILFSVDHILPKITPNISYWFRGIRNPLQAFFTSLEKIKKLDVEYVFPSHFQPFQHANKRIDEILIHHEERLEKTVQSVREPSAVYEVTNRMFNGLNIHETRFAIGETLAHLEYLIEIKQCRKFEENGLWFYEAT